MQLQSLRHLYEHELRDLHDAEGQLIEAFPKLIEAAHDESLKKELDRHFGLTREHRARLDRVLEGMKSKEDGVVCHGMKGLLREAQEIAGDSNSPENVRDAGLVSSAQKIEHYQIAGYGTLRAFAETLNEESARELLASSLEEESETDRRLTRIARDSLNKAAKVH